MRIVGLFTETFGTGGIQRINRHVCLALSEFAEREGHEVSLLSLMDDPNGVDDRYLAGDACFRGFQGNKSSFVTAALAELRYRPDLVYAAHVNLAPVALMMQRLKPSLCYGVALYGIDVWEKLPLAKRYALQQAAFITSLSKYTTEQSIKLQSLIPQRVHLLPPALDPFWMATAQQPTRHDIDLPDGKMLLTVTRLAAAEKYKGVDCVIKALPRVIEQIPDVYYVVVGSGSDLERLQFLAKQEGINQRVLFVGEKVGAALQAYYNCCDLFVMPSKGEGFGIVFLEAMFYKKPVIAGDHAGSRDVVNDKQTGRLIKHGDIEGLSDAMINLLNDSESNFNMGNAGYNRLIKNYRYSTFKKSLINIISINIRRK